MVDLYVFGSINIKSLQRRKHDFKEFALKAAFFPLSRIDLWVVQLLGSRAFASVANGNKPGFPQMSSHFWLTEGNFLPLIFEKHTHLCQPQHLDVHSLPQPENFHISINFLIPKLQWHVNPDRDLYCSLNHVI